MGGCTGFSVAKFQADANCFLLANVTELMPSHAFTSEIKSNVLA